MQYPQTSRQSVVSGMKTFGEYVTSVPWRRRRASAIRSSSGVVRRSRAESAIGVVGIRRAVSSRRSSEHTRAGPRSRCARADCADGAARRDPRAPHGAAERARPARLTVVEWRHGPRSEEAFGRFMALRHPGSAGMVSVGGRHGGVPDESSWTTHALVRGARRGSGRRRPACRRAGATSCGTATAGSRGTPTGERRRANRPRSRARDGRPTASCSTPTRSLAALTLASGSPTEVAGRAAWQVTAVPRDDETGTGALFRVGARRGHDPARDRRRTRGAPALRVVSGAESRSTGSR